MCSSTTSVVMATMEVKRGRGDERERQKYLSEVIVAAVSVGLNCDQI